jgi:MFS family permease
MQSAGRSSDDKSRTVFLATWLGWMLDGFDASIYAYVLVLALAELLPASGIEATSANISFYGGILFAIFMIGWACSMAWGWAADHYGRVSVLCWTVLVYSVFTAATGLVAGVVMFAVFRFLTGFGVGGEWAAGTPLLHERVPERRRVLLAGWLHTAAPTGLFLAAFVVLVVGEWLGWRGLFLVGILPALLVLYLRRAFPDEPSRSHRTQGLPFRLLFSESRSRTTWAAALMLTTCIFGLWSSNFWAPTVVIMKLVATGMAPANAQEIGAIAGLLTNAGTFVACLAMPFITTALGSRRLTAALFFLGATTAVVAAYGMAVAWLDSMVLFFALLPLVGFFTNGIFSLFTIWLPEMFPSALRGSGSGFAFSFGRLLGAAGPFLIGTTAAATGSLPLSIALFSAIYLAGLPFIALSPETAGRPLPR